MQIHLFFQTIFLILLLVPGSHSPQKESNVTHLEIGVTELDTNYLILLPTGQIKSDFPVLKPMPIEDIRHPIIVELFSSTFLREMIPLNDSVQSMLLQEGLISKKEPLYLLFSGTMGGFPRSGFYLESGSDTLDKTTVLYVDLADVDEGYNKIGSITQIYPHELAHVFYRQLTQRNPYEEESNSLDIHYFSIVTDYAKAFNEGYAESFENLSRANEPMQRVREGVERNVVKKEKMFPAKVRGFNRDFLWPCRIGFYKMTMLFWFQQLEHYKRYIWSKDGLAKYQSAVFSTQSPESRIQNLGSRISYRNACITYDTNLILNEAQAAANEGVVSSFFTIFRQEVADANIATMQEELFREFHVMKKYLRDVPAGEPLLHLFINGYIAEYPDDKQIITEAYSKATGQEYKGDSIPELWLFNPDYVHTYWVMAQVGGAQFPAYTINLNTAREDDLLTLNGITLEQANLITSYRDSTGLFRSFEDIRQVPDLPVEIQSMILDHQLKAGDLESVDFEGGFSFWTLIIDPVKRMLWVAGIIMGIVSVVLYFLFYFRKRGIKKVLWMVIRTFFKAIMFVIAGLAGVILLQQSIYVIIGFTLLLLVINFLRTKNKPGFRIELILSTVIMAIVIGYSII